MILIIVSFDSQKFEELNLSNDEELSGRDQELQDRFSNLIDILDSVQRDIKDR